MNARTPLRGRRRLLALLPVLAATGGALVAAVSGTAAPAPASGLVCTSHATGGGPNGTGASSFALTARKGRITTPDAESILMWGFAEEGHGYQYPSPFLCVTEGDLVTVTLRNDLPVKTSIVFPGQESVLANGVAAAPVGTGGDASLAPTVDPGDTITYTFVAAHPGTFMYESGTDQARQVNMGLFGGLIVHPATDTPTSRSLTGPGTEYQVEANGHAQDYAMLLSDVDPFLHLAVEQGKPYDLAKYTPRYFFINGRSFPDTVAPNYASWLPSQPYSALVHIEEYVPGDRPAAVRYLNASYVTHPFHPHANHTRLVGRDGASLVTGTPGSPGAVDDSTEHFSIPVGPGQTWDMLYDWTDVDGFDPQSNAVPTLIPSLNDQQHASGDSYWSGSPYLGVKGQLPPGVASNNVCGEYYHVAHSHAIQEATNYGAAMGGMLTLIRVDPDGGCPQ